MRLKHWCKCYPRIWPTLLGSVVDQCDYGGHRMAQPVCKWLITAKERCVQLGDILLKQLYKWFQCQRAAQCLLLSQFSCDAWGLHHTCHFCGGPLRSESQRFFEQVSHLSNFRNSLRLQVHCPQCFRCSTLQRLTERPILTHPLISPKPILVQLLFGPCPHSNFVRDWLWSQLLTVW